MMTDINKPRMKVLVSLLLIGLLFGFSDQALTVSAAQCTFLVSPSGSDSNNGTSTVSAFKTIQKGINSLTPGGVLCVRSGTYYEAIRLSKSGSASSPLTITAYPGEKPIIDGRAGVDGLNTGLPSCPNGCSNSQLARVDPISGKGYVWESLVSITGSYITFEGFEIKRSMGRGVSIVGATQVGFRNNSIQHSRHGGILVYSDASYVTVEGNKIWWNADFAPYSRGNSLNWPMIVMVRGQHVTIRNNQVFNNWGEGIGAGRGARYITIEGNTVFDNYALQIYVDHAQEVLINGNLAYFSGDPTFYRGGKPSECIAINNETSSTEHLNKNITVTNNLVRGCLYNFGLWVQGSKWGTENLLVAHNTFVDGYEGGIRIARADAIAHKNVRFKNNIVIQRSGKPIALSTTAGISFSHNLWWPQQPTSAAVGSGDVTNDPVLAFSGSGASYFSINSAGSPAIGAALLDGDAVAADYYGNTRGPAADMGAIEFADSGSQSLPTAQPTAQPTEQPTAQPTAQPTTQPTAQPTSATKPIFDDVHANHPFFAEIEILYKAGYTAGCSTDPMMYCPESGMNRAESAVFVERGLRGAGYLPPAPTMPLFDDLPPDSWAAKWAYRLYFDGYTAGCSAAPLRYCPWDENTRTEGTVFYLRMLHGLVYTPPDPKGIFSDVPLESWGAKWIEAAYTSGLIPACEESPLLFCPDDALTRAVAAYMMVQAKGLE